MLSFPRSMRQYQLQIFLKKLAQLRINEKQASADHISCLTPPASSHHTKGVDFLRKRVRNCSSRYHLELRRISSPKRKHTLLPFEPVTQRPYRSTTIVASVYCCPPVQLPGLLWFHIPYPSAFPAMHPSNPRGERPHSQGHAWFFFNARLVFDALEVGSHASWW